MIIAIGDKVKVLSGFHREIHWPYGVNGYTTYRQIIGRTMEVAGFDLCLQSYDFGSSTNIDQYVCIYLENGLLYPKCVIEKV